MRAMNACFTPFASAKQWAFFASENNPAISQHAMFVACFFMMVLVVLCLVVVQSLLIS